VKRASARWLLPVAVAMVAGAGAARADDLARCKALGWRAQLGTPPAYDFMPRNYFFWSPNTVRRDGEDRDLIFEAQVGLHLPIFGVGFGSDPRCGWGYDTVFFMPSIMFRLRMLDTPSLPVIPFSGMPTPLQFQYLHRKVWTVTGESTPERELVIGITPVVWAHHSNGQDGCFWDGQMRDANGVCQGPEDLVNERNGTFSTNFTALTVAGRYGELDGYEGPRWMARLSATYQRHHDDSPFPGGLEPEMRGIWALNRVIVGGEYRQYRIGGTDWGGYGAGEVELAFPGVDEIDDQRLATEVGVFPPGYSRFGFFAGWVWGQEYYNILFTERVNMLRIGVTYDTSALIPELAPMESPRPTESPRPRESPRPGGASD
jgi:hypothetical protein